MKTENIPTSAAPSPWIVVRVMATTLAVLTAARWGLRMPEDTSSFLAAHAGMAHFLIEAVLAVRKLNRRIRQLRKEIAEAGSDQAAVPAATASAK